MLLFLEGVQLCWHDSVTITENIRIYYTSVDYVCSSRCMYILMHPPIPSSSLDLANTSLQ